MSEKDHLKAYRYDPATGTVRYDVDPDPVFRAVLPSAASTEPPNAGMPGGACSVSADGNENGIVWVSYPQADGQWQKVAGYLVAYAAAPGGQGNRTLVELWRDSRPALFAKFCPPTIADGKVFRATFAPNGPEPDNAYIGPGRVVVYGLTSA
jgi:hypothetical protein